MTTLLPLEDFRREIGAPPWGFWGLYGSIGVSELTNGCNPLTLKYGWQNVDAAGREDIEHALARAEEKLFEQLRYWPAPKYTEKTFPWPQFNDRRVSIVGYAGGTGQWQTVNAGESYIQEVGVLTRTLIEANVPITLTDEDGDGLLDTFTSDPVVTTVTDVKEIALYFSAAQRWDGSAVSEDWRVRPINVTISGGNAVITGKAWTVVRPVLYEGALATEGLDAEDTAIYASTLDVYWLYINPTGTTVDTGQAAMIWQTPPYPYFCECDPVNNSRDPAALAYATARVGIHDHVTGELNAGQAVYNSDTGLWCSPSWPAWGCPPPDRITIRYQAGKPLDENGHVDRRMKQLLVMLACAELTRNICACDTANRALYHWQFDLARTGGAGDESYGAIAPEDLSNPWGTRRGQVEAWKLAKQIRVLTGFSVVGVG